MKLQYLGDSKDSFKWDYHDFLTSSLNYPLLNIALMMTPDDGGNDGKSHPTLFPARDEVIEFCHDLRESRSLETINSLPARTGNSYRINLHNSGEHFRNRQVYFSNLKNAENQVLLLDPDNGFEPEKSRNEKHISYGDISGILGQLPKQSVVSVFQHHRRKSFPDDYAQIKERIEPGFSTAIYWHSLMFVQITTSTTAINKVLRINKLYAAANPVRVLA